jgi:uncharacterized membrane protein YdjX (TVP38/TMEM64 family)
MKEKFARYLPYILSGVIILALAAAYAFSQTFRQNIQEGWNLILQGDRQAVSNWFKSFGFWGPLFILLFMFLQMITLVLPSWLLMVVAVLGYGPFWGGLLAVAGVTMAAIIAFWLGRGLGEGALRNLIGEKTEKKMDQFLEDYGIGAVALFRLSPFLSNDAISFVAGMLCMRFWRFLAGTLIGLVPLTVALAFFSRSPDQLKNGLIWVGAGGIVLYGIYIWLDKRSDKKKSKG